MNFQIASTKKILAEHNEFNANLEKNKEFSRNFLVLCKN